MRHRVSVPLPPGTPISIHAPREGCDLDGNGEPVRRVISIHAPREGCDFADGTSTNNDTQISIHAPREGCDTASELAVTTEKAFQSTHPVRGATPPLSADPPGLPISIHAPREGCDRMFAYLYDIRTKFQSTHPVRGATGTCAPPSYFVENFNPRTP